MCQDKNILINHLKILLKNYRLSYFTFWLLVLLIGCQPKESAESNSFCPHLAQIDSVKIKIPIEYNPSLTYPIFVNFDSSRLVKAGGYSQLTQSEIQSKASISLDIFGSDQESLEVCECSFEGDTVELKIRSYNNSTGGVFLSMIIIGHFAFVECIISSDYKQSFFIPLKKGNFTLKNFSMTPRDTIYGFVMLETAQYFWRDTCVISRMNGSFRCILSEKK